MIHYNEYGEGKPLVLLHGFCETSEMWDGYIDSLSQKFNVLIPDLPGFGRSPSLDYDFSIDDIGNIMGCWLEEQNVEEPVTIIGHSLGGYVALSLVKQFPHLVNKLGLFHSTALADSEEKKESRNKTIEFIQKYGSKVFAESFVASLFYIGNRKRVKETVKKVVSIAAEVSDESMIGYTEAMRDRLERTDVLKTFDGPILFIAGEHDTAVPLDNIQQQVDLPKRPVIHILKDTGHMGMFEQKEETLGIIEGFAL